MKTFIKGLLLTIHILLIISCKKEGENPATECLLTKMSFSSGEMSVTIEYDFNKNPSAIKTCYLPNASGCSCCSCSYPEFRNNQLYKIQFEGFCGRPDYTWNRDLTLNDKGQIIAQALYSNADTPCFLIREYNNQGKLAKYYGSCDTSSASKKVFFSYLPDGNVKEIVQNTWTAFDFQAYDNKKSILNANPVWMAVTFESEFWRFLPHLGWGDSYAYSPNNPTKYRYNHGSGYITVNLKYEYNAQGYPIKCEGTSFIEDLNSTRKWEVFFEYKCR